MMMLMMSRGRIFRRMSRYGDQNHRENYEKQFKEIHDVKISYKCKKLNYNQCSMIFVNNDTIRRIKYNKMITFLLLTKVFILLNLGVWNVHRVRLVKYM